MSVAVIKFQGARAGTTIPMDNFESYTDGSNLSGLNAGVWGGAYVVRSLGITDQENFESYTDGVSVNGLGGGSLGWSAAFVARDTPFGLKSSEDYESYTDTANLNSLNGGVGWLAAFISR